MSAPTAMISLSPADEKYASSVNKVAQAILSKGKVVIISGAGISVSCGIPVQLDIVFTFRTFDPKTDSIIKRYEGTKRTSS